jgi:hypothetical protein
VREINRLSIHQWLRSAIPDSQQPISPIGFLFLKLPPPPCAVLLVCFDMCIFRNFTLYFFHILIFMHGLFFHILIFMHGHWEASLLRSTRYVSSSCSGIYTAEMTLSVIEKTINDSKVLPYDASFIPVTAFDFS